MHGEGNGNPLQCSCLDPWDSPGRNTGIGCHFLLQEIFPTQRSNSGLPHCRQILYYLSHSITLYILSEFLLTDVVLAAVDAAVNLVLRARADTRLGEVSSALQ